MAYESRRTNESITYPPYIISGWTEYKLSAPTVPLTSCVYPLLRKRVLILHQRSGFPTSLSVSAETCLTSRCLAMNYAGFQASFHNIYTSMFRNMFEFKSLYLPDYDFCTFVSSNKLFRRPESLINGRFRIYYRSNARSHPNWDTEIFKESEASKAQKKLLCLLLNPWTKDFHFQIQVVALKKLIGQQNLHYTITNKSGRFSA
jgi:hypothetical protein